MTDCKTILELLPWYATGKLDSQEATQVAIHLQTCESCRNELTEILWMRHGFVQNAKSPPKAIRRIWRRVASETGVGDSAQVDVGSFLVGFQLGVNTGRRGSPVEARLRLMGQDVRIIGRKRKPSRGSARSPRDV